MYIQIVTIIYIRVYIYFVFQKGLLRSTIFCRFFFSKAFVKRDFHFSFSFLPQKSQTRILHNFLSDFLSDFPDILQDKMQKKVKKMINLKF